MIPKKLIITITLAALLPAVAILQSASIAMGQQEFMAELTGDNEVPPVETEASGSSIFTVMEDGVQFSVNVSNTKQVTMAHIHSGVEGENGDVVYTLFSTDSPMDVDGNLAEGTITADKLEGPMQGKQLTDLATAMQDGSTYVNVHTVQNEAGEIRGQIMPSDGNATTMGMQ